MLLDLRCTGFSHVAGTPLDQERTQERFMGKFGTKTLNFREEFFSFSSHFWDTLYHILLCFNHLGYNGTAM